MAVYPSAKWEPLPANSKQARMTPRVVIIHRAVDAAGKTDLFGWFVQSGLESHFFVQLDGTVLQYMDTGVVAEANYKANGFAVSIETEDDGTAIPFTSAQVDALVRLVDWLCRTHNIPRRQANRWDGSGIGWHSMWGINTKANPALNPWTSVMGKDCPSAARIAQTRDVIIPRVAGHQVEGDMPSVQEIVDAIKNQVLAGDWRFDGNRNPIDMQRQAVATGFSNAEKLDALLAKLDALSGAVSDDEQKVIGALTSTRTAILTAVAAIPPSGKPTDEQIDDLAARLKDGLGEEVAGEVGRRLVQNGATT